MGPATLQDLEYYLDRPIRSKGYPFPLIPILAREYLAQGHSVVVVTTATDIDLPLRFESGRFSLHVVNSRPRARYRAMDMFRSERLAMMRILREIDADIIHAHWTYEFALAAAHAKAGPVVATAHDSPWTILRRMPNPYRGIRAIMALWARMTVTNLTAVSPDLALKWRRQMFYRRAIEVITNPLPPVAEGRSDPSGKAIILDIANDSRLKNVKVLLRAFARILMERPNVELRLVGAGLEPYGSLATWALKRGLSANVNFLGPLSREDVARELASASVFCHTSLEESQGVALVEAMGTGVPVIGGVDSGAVGWTLFDGKAGLLVNVKSVDAVVEALEEVLAAPLEAKQRALIAKQLVRERHDPRTIADAYLAVYDRAIAQKSSRPDRNP